ncbi:MAG TPA: hypothetical protein VHM26_12245 [Chitinophagaceae bacterium]|jgi:hypothetical protein|nr:hypothetical protein [Chitinophagaceae bacterium]
MKKLSFLAVAVCMLHAFSVIAQNPSNFVLQPHHLAIDSKDNVYVLSLSGLDKITPDGNVQHITDRSSGKIVIDSKDNIYLASPACIFKLKIDNSGKGQFEVYAGSYDYSGNEDGTLKTATFNNIAHFVIDKNDNLYVMEKAWPLVNKVGKESSKWFDEPNVPTKLNQSDYWYYVRKINDGKVSSLKNDAGQYVLFHNVAGMAVDSAGNILTAGGGMSRAIRKFDVRENKFVTVAGKPFKREWCPVYTVGDTSKAELFDPGFMIFDKKGDLIYSDNRSHRITKITNRIVSTVAGNNKIQPCGDNIGGRAQEGYKDGKALTALFNFPEGMAYDSKGNLFIADEKNSCVRKLSTDGNVTTITYFDRSKARIDR